MTNKLLTLNRQNLLNAISKIYNFASNGTNTNIILSNVLLVNVGGIMTLTANNNESEITTKINDVVGDDVALTVNATKLKAILESSTVETIDLLLSIADEEGEDGSISKAIIKVGKSKFTLQSLSSGKYPKLQLSGDCKTEFNIESKKLAEMLNKTKLMMSKNDARQFLNGALFEVKGDKFSVVATNAVVMGVISFNVNDIIGGDSRSVIPRKTINRLSKLLDSLDSINVNVKMYDSCVVIDIGDGNFYLISKVVMAEYPNYERLLMPYNNNVVDRYNINPKILWNALSCVRCIGDGKLNAVSFTLNKDVATAFITNNDDEASDLDFNIEYCTENKLSAVDIDVNINYLSNIIEPNLSNDNMEWLILNTGGNSILRTSILINSNSEDFTLKYLIMPITLR